MSGALNAIVDKHHTLQERFVNFCKPATTKVKAFFNHPTVKKIRKIVVPIFVIAITGFSLWANPITTVVGLGIGIIFPEKVQHVVDKIKEFLKKGFWPYVGLAIVACAFVSPLALLVAGTFLWSANVGKWATESYRKIKGQNNDNDTPDATASTAISSSSSNQDHSSQLDVSEDHLSENNSVDQGAENILIQELVADAPFTEN